MPRRRRSPMLSKPAVKHSGTLLFNDGAANTVHQFDVLKTSGGPRSTTGAPQTIQSFSSTDEDCKTADVVKLINLHLQCGPRNFDTIPPEDRTGWIEWALVLVRENETIVPNTRIGVQTLGDIATNMYRGECIYTGNLPVGGAQPSTGEISLKIPKNKQKIKLGDEWRFLTYFRAVNSASLFTDSVRTVKSYNYRVR